MMKVLFVLKDSWGWGWGRMMFGLALSFENHFRVKDDGAPYVSQTILYWFIVKRASV